MSSDKILGGEKFLLEVQLEGKGLHKEDIEVQEVERYVPEEFVEAADKNYYEELIKQIKNVENGMGKALIEGEEKLIPVSIKNNKIYKDDKELISDLNKRPALYSVESGIRKKKFWDGDTFVARPKVEERKLVLEAFEGSYAERLAAKNFVDQYPINKLPLSMNITVTPVMKKESEKVIPIFRRNRWVEEDPGYLTTVAGGIHTLGINPLDAGWKEMIEEIRIGPNCSKKNYAKRKILDPEEVKKIREGQVEGNSIYTLPGDNGQEIIYRTNGEMIALGVVRNLETHAPEVIASVNTELDYEVVKENYSRAEYESINAVSFDNLKEFLEQNDDIVPVSRAGLILTAGLEDEFIKKYDREELPKAYKNFDTIRLN